MNKNKCEIYFSLHFQLEQHTFREFKGVQPFLKKNWSDILLKIEFEYIKSPRERQA